jgi:large subunit ribosomal protein L22
MDRPALGAEVRRKFMSEVKAVGRYLRVTPTKARYVLDAVRGKTANEALAMLKFVPNEAARYIRTVLESAVANAEHNEAWDREALRVVRCYADVGPTLKRIHPRAMGRAYRILKRTSHITVVVAEDEKLKRSPVKARGRGRAQIAQKAQAAPRTPERKSRAKKAAPEAKPEKARAAKTKTAPEQKEE